MALVAAGNGVTRTKGGSSRNRLCGGAVVSATPGGARPAQGRSTIQGCMPHTCQVGDRIRSVRGLTSTCCSSDCPDKAVDPSAQNTDAVPPLWPTSAIGVSLLLDFSRQFNKSSDCFSTRWEVGLAAAPVVYHLQKLLRYPHLKRAILRALRWAATRPNAAAHFCTFCIDNNASKE